MNRLILISTSVSFLALGVILDPPVLDTWRQIASVFALTAGSIFMYRAVMDD